MSSVFDLSKADFTLYVGGVYGLSESGQEFRGEITKVHIQNGHLVVEFRTLMTRRNGRWVVADGEKSNSFNLKYNTVRQEACNRLEWCLHMGGDAWIATRFDATYGRMPAVSREPSPSPACHQAWWRKVLKSWF
jgi:hypothetical protein